MRLHLEEILRSNFRFGRMRGQKQRESIRNHRNIRKGYHHEQLPF